MQTLRKKTSPCKYRNDPGRFFGDGVQFKAKLIGILEVGEARGDRMCQEALQDLKMAIRAAGEHKQRITIHVTIDGLRLRDEKTGDSLYHHPVHKISFIAQDMTDSRAFGYIFGSPDSGHRFFGIKTDKAASQVVLAMRDLFQVVFELKKKEIELARQQIQSKSIHEHQLSSLSSLKNASGSMQHNDLSGAVGSSILSGSNAAGSLSGGNRLGVNMENRSSSKELSPESVADLVDLEQELSSLQRGITQMERITPSEAALANAAGGPGNSLRVGNDEDPFGDSFTNFPAYNLLPPPESGRNRNKPSKGNEGNNLTMAALLATGQTGSGSPSTLQQIDDNDDESWLRELDQHSDVFDTTKSNTLVGAMSMGGLPMAPLAPSESTSTPTQQLSENSGHAELPNGATDILTGSVTEVNAAAALLSDAFTDLDPLGTGRTRPYVDKKYFFQELKNPPKKVLKDLTNNSSGNGGGGVAISSALIHTADTNTSIQTSAAMTVCAVDEFLSKDAAAATSTTSTNIIKSTNQASNITAIINTSASASISSSSPSAITTTTTTTTNTTTTNAQHNIKHNKSSSNSLNLSKPPHSYSVNQPQLVGLNINRTTATCRMSNLSANSGTDAVSSSDVIMMPHDTDPFSPTRKKSDPDPFQEGDLFSKLESFEFGSRIEGGAAAAAVASTAATHTSPTPPPPNHQPPAPPSSQTASAGDTAYNSPLQVQLPPEPSQAPLHWKADISRLERPASEMSMSGTGSTVRSRPSTASYSISAGASSYAQAAALKQQTVDVISSISNKKMPHLFGQARFSKRDSNTINMRRLQESDSLSENETAPEPPPRPDSTPYSEPPPLPPKKQFSDIVIRPRSSTTLSQSGSNRYESLSSSSKTTAAVGRPMAGDVPPIPLPSRRVGRSDGTYPGPSRPRKPGHTEDDYLAPISDCTSGSVNSLGPDVPPLLPPPTQTSTRVRTQRQQSLSKQPPHDIYENKEEILQQQLLMKKEQYGAEHMNAPLAPDITLTQLLTLGIDDLAARLNVPTSKLSTMTLVELTSYLSDYLTAEHSKPKKESEGSIFRVSFDQQSTFVAKFDDTFGEDPELPNGNETFVANFEQFNEPPVPQTTTSSIPAVPPADRYAVFREIIDQELQHQQENTDLMGDLTPPPNEEPTYLEMADAQTGEPMPEAELEVEFDNSDFMGTPAQQQHQAPTPTMVMPKIDTKITEVVAQAKDRYAALRDIILVENLFDKKPSPIATAGIMDSNVVQDFTEFSDEFNEDQDLRQIMEERAGSLGAADRLGIVDSRGLAADASSSALTVEDDDEEDEDADGGGESSGDSNEKDAGASGGGLLQDQYEKLSTSNQQLDSEKLQANELGDMTECAQLANKPSIKQDNKFLTVSGSSGFTGSKDDLEIDELMQRAISNLSLDSRERISPANSMNQRQTHSAAAGIAPMSAVTPSGASLQAPSQYNDMSTSPIPMQKSPIPSATSSVAGMSLGKSTAGGKSPQVSPIPSQLSAVSQLIDTVSRQVGSAKETKDSWATFDTSSGGGGSGIPLLEHPINEKRPGSRKQTGKSGKMSAATSLHLPPPPPSNTSQNDTAESPVSSDPREDGWRKGKPGSAGGGGAGGSRRWTKKERQQTSSSSRDISPWDDEAPDYQKHKRMPPVAPHHERHGYYMRHAKRMNSCDEDFDYDEEINSRRDQRKFKHGLSRSRDNFELDSPSWYHHQAAYTWTAQDIEQARGRSFERSAYERSTYGPPIYDKRGVPLQPMSGAASYDRRSAGGGYDKRKYYRDYTRPNYDFDEYGESPPPMPERGVYRGDSGSFEKLKLGRRADYENVYDESGRGGSGGYKSRAEYMYERDRKSFDRESVESFESATRRRRSFGSGGDMYGSLESREDFRERYLGGAGGEKTRSLRRATKLRVAGEIDYEQDSEGDFQHQQQQQAPSSSQQRGRTIETRSLQRPSQLNTGSMAPPSMSQTRVRKSSGSSPWDGEEPPPLGQKPWKRPSSAADSERRLTESRRAAALTQTPSGSDGEKDRRFRKKQRPRAKDTHGAAIRTGSATGTTGGRYGNITGPRDNYDYIACDDDIDDDDDYVDDEYGEPPTDEDKFERLNRRRHEMHQRMHESERRQYGGGGSSHKVVPPPFKSSGSGVSGMPSKKYQTNSRNDYDFDHEYDHKPPTHAANAQSIPSGSGTDLNSKFSFDGGFESDFNQSSPPPAATATPSSCNSTPAANIGANSTVGGSKASFRFSNDFSDRERAANVGGHGAIGKTMQDAHHHQPQQFDHETRISPAQAHSHAHSSSSHVHNTPPIQQKLRFDDNVKVSQFDDGAFEDDFAKSSFDFEKADQWNVEALNKATNGNTAAAAAANAARKHSIRNSKLQQRQELIKKSESINIFAKKSEDPFEDDEFFTAPTGNEDGAAAGEDTSSAGATTGVGFQWEDETNFAKFDKNM